MKSMKRCLSILAVIAMLTSAAALKTAMAQHEHMGHHDEGRATTVKGELVDLSCYISHGGKGAAHQKCAIACINKGLPMGVLTKDSKLYLLIEDHDKASAYASAKKYAGKQITVTGALRTKDGMKAISVASVK